MKIRKSRGRSEQPLLQPLPQSAQGSEKHEEEVDMEDAELLIGFSHAIWNQYDAQRDSTAPSTKSEELPETETVKEVAVRSVNPSRQVQDGEVSMANSIDTEINGDEGIEKQREGSEELTGLEMLAAIALGAGSSNLNPLLIEESESDSEVPTWLHPSSAPDSEVPAWLQPTSAPEGSLLHALYLQLVGAGSDGITVRELFKSFKKPAEALGFASDWKVQVRWHLKTNPLFCEVQGYHYLVSNHQLEEQQPKRSPENIASSSRRYGASSSNAVLSNHHSTPAAVQPGLSVDTQEGVIRTRRKAFQKANAALTEQATEFEEMHQSTGDMHMPSSVADPTDSQLVSHVPLSTSTRKRKSSASHDEELTHQSDTVPGGLQATQAEVLAKTEVQTGQRCVVMKDDIGNWRCQMMAMVGDDLCNHHRSLQLQEDGKTPLSPNPGNPKYLTAFRPWIAPEARVQTSVLCGHRHKSKDGTRSSQCSTIAMKGDRLCEYHKLLREERKARQRSDAHQGKQGATNLQHNQDSTIRGLPESHTNLDQSSLPRHPKSATISLRISREDTPSRTEVAKNVDKPAAGVSNHDDDSKGEQLQQQMPKNVPKRHHVAARKTAANVGPLKSQGLIRTPTTPPLPPPHGIRRKTPVKNTGH